MDMLRRLSNNSDRLICPQRFTGTNLLERIDIVNSYSLIKYVAHKKSLKRFEIRDLSINLRILGKRKGSRAPHKNENLDNVASKKLLEKAINAMSSVNSITV